MNSTVSAIADRLSRAHLPVGSLVIDVGLVIFLAYAAGQMTTKFQQMDDRLLKVEQTEAAENATQRLAVLERRADDSARDRERDRAEILSYLQRIESKVDGKADKR